MKRIMFSGMMLISISCFAQAGSAPPGQKDTVTRITITLNEQQYSTFRFLFALGYLQVDRTNNPLEARDAVKKFADSCATEWNKFIWHLPPKQDTTHKK